MTSSGIRPEQDPTRPSVSPRLAIEFAGEVLEGYEGQTLAGVILGTGRTSWRITGRDAMPRGVFCGIGVCFECIATVNGLPDVRLCQREAFEGDVVTPQAEQRTDTSSARHPVREEP